MALKKRRGLPGINPEGWLMSYADMATILLALFIVLSNLGKDQTGVSLNQGLESYRQAAGTFGLGSLLDGAAQPIAPETPNPHFGSESLDPPADDTPPGRSIDAEQEQMQRFLEEMNRSFRVSKLPRVGGEATLDLFDKLNRQPPYLMPRHQAALHPLLALLQRPNYRVTLLVWATTPSDSAWQRAGEQAHAAAAELSAAGRLNQAARSRLTALGQPWRYPNFERPVLSLVIARVAAQ